MNRLGGYAFASAVEARIEQIRLENPITPETVMGWSTFIRTLRTTLDILDQEAREVMSAELTRTEGGTKV